MNWKKNLENIYKRSKSRGRKFKGSSTSAGFGPIFPDSGNFDMSSVPGGNAGYGAPSGGGCSGGCGAVLGESIVDADFDDDELTMSDDDKLLYALRGIIENAKIAYEAVSGIPYDEE